MTMDAVTTNNQCLFFISVKYLKYIKWFWFHIYFLTIHFFPLLIHQYLRVTWLYLWFFNKILEIYCAGKKSKPYGNSVPGTPFVIHLLRSRNCHYRNQKVDKLIGILQNMNIKKVIQTLTVIMLGLPISTKNK